MRVILQAESGGRAGHRIWLGANQRVFVGATEWAEFAVPGDPQLGDVQFVMESDYHRCRIRNLHKSRELLVNGKPISEQTLVDGDIVVAGNTQFSVGIQETPEIAARQAAIRGTGDTTFGAPQFSYRVERCQSGLMRYSGRDGAPTPLEVARLLAGQHSFYLLVHAIKAGLRDGPEMENVVDLFHRERIPLSARQENSVLVFSPHDAADRFGLLEQHWNKCAVVGVFTSREYSDVIETLFGANLWLCPPDLICDHLACGAPYHVQQLLEGIKAVLLETDEPGGWSVFASPEIAPLWMQLGFSYPPAHNQGHTSKSA